MGSACAVDIGGFKRNICAGFACLTWKTLSAVQSEGLKMAFRQRDRRHATTVALGVNGIDEREMETALEH